MSSDRSRLEGRSVVVLAEELYEELELWYPVLRLREAGATVVVAGTGAKLYHGKHGYPVEVDRNVQDLAAADHDALVVPGGYAPDRLRRYPDVLRVAQEMFRQDSVVAAICHGAWVLISAGVVTGRRMTCYSSIKDDVINAGAKYVDQEVVRDGNLISSRRPSDLGAFCHAIIEAMTGACADIQKGSAP